MEVDNRWKKGRGALHVPPLPERQRGVSGCLLARAVFDSAIGQEVYLAVLEEPSWCVALAASRPPKIFCKTCAAQTRYGHLIILVWTVAAGSPAETVYEQFLNPDNADTLRIIWSVAHQTHLKALVINSRSSEVVDWFEFENVFEFGKLLDGAMRMEPETEVADFDAAMEEFRQRYSVQDLLKA